MLLAVAAVLAWASGTPRLAIAIAAVILLNAGFAFAQEMQAEKAVEALAAFLPEHARVLRDGTRQEIQARLLVPGDVLLIEEGERICADARLMTGTLEVDMSTLTGESVPVTRSAGPADTGVPLLQAADVVFSGTACTGGEAEALVTATGMHTELGRIAALSQRAGRSESPLEHQVKRATMLIAFVAVGAGIAFLPIGLAAGLSVAAAASFAIGLLVANVPEGLLPTITLALAVGVREMARRGALVKRLSRGGDPRVHLGHLHRQDRHPHREPDARHHRMDPRRRSQPAGRRGRRHPGGSRPGRRRPACSPREWPRATTRTCTAPAGSRPVTRPSSPCSSWPPAAAPTSPWPAGETRRRQLFRFDPRLKLMTTVDEQDGGLVVNTKGAPEEVLARVTRIHRGGRDVPITAADRDAAARVMTDYARPRPAGAGRSPSGPARRVRRPRPARGRRAGPVPDRAGGHARPAPAAGPRGDRPAAPGRHPRPRGHRRQRADRRRDRPPVGIGTGRRHARWSPAPSWTR